MTLDQPTFPPLLAGHPAADQMRPRDQAVREAKDATLGAGDLIWSTTGNLMQFALVLEPEVSRVRCGEMLYAAMVAFGDAAGALIPPEVSITYLWPNTILMNDGAIGSVDLIVSDEDVSSCPDWMVLSMEIQMMPDLADMNPGENYDVTTLWDEGCGDVTAIELLESTSRHLVNAIHVWSEDGFKPIHDQWMGRLNEKQQLVHPLRETERRFLGLDEQGGGILSVSDAHQGFDLLQTLKQLRETAGNEE